MGLFAFIGALLINFTEELGAFLILFKDTLRWIPRRPLGIKLILQQIEEVGFNSLPVVLITAMFTGMVLALQSYNAFHRFGAESLIGTVIALSMCRELGPVLTGVIVAGRAGSAMAAELGTMKVTEQIDALYTLAANPVKYLIVPRFLAGVISLPLLCVLADGIGILGGYLVSVNMLGINGVVYMKATFRLLDMKDILSGIIKAFFFGGFVSMVGCYKGFFAEGGAEGVGQATTGSVVISSMCILISDYFLTAILF